MKAIFVTGTDTDVGKTIASAWLCQHWQADYWKPIQSGLADGTDTDTIKNLITGRQHPESYRLSKPLSPHASAACDGIQIRLDKLSLPTGSERLVVEGAGGLLVPLNEQDVIADLVKQLNLPCIIVARSGLGTINHTCLTLEAARARGIKVLGVIMMGESNPPNRQAIEHYGKTKVLAELPWLTPLGRDALNQVVMPTECRTVLNQL